MTSFYLPVAPTCFCCVSTINNKMDDMKHVSRSLLDRKTQKVHVKYSLQNQRWLLSFKVVLILGTLFFN